MKKLFIMLAAGTILGACTDTKVKPLDEKALYEYKVNQAKSNVENIPSWFLKLPTEDNAVFSVGTSAMPDLQLASDIAILNAKAQLADRVNSRLRQQTKTFVSKIGEDDIDMTIINEVERTTRNLIVDADVSGYSIREMKILAQGTQYRVYVLLAYGDNEAKKVLKNRIMQERALYAKIRESKAFKELDEVVEGVKKSEIDNTIAKLEKSN